MFKLLLISLLLLSLGTPAYALTKQETQLEYAYQVMNLTDFLTTERVLDQGGYERNPLLGRNPSDERLVYTAIAFGLVLYGFTKVISPEYRSTWQWITLVGKVASTGGNLIEYKW